MFSSITKSRRAIKRALKIRTRRNRHGNRRREKVFRVVLFALAIVTVGVFYPQSDLFSPVFIPQEGDRAREDFIAPIVITLRKTEGELAEERRIARNASPIVMDYDSTVVDSVGKFLAKFISEAQDLRDSLTLDSINDFGVYAEILSRDFPFMSSASLREAYHADSLSTVVVRLQSILNENIYFSGVLSSIDQLKEYAGRPIVVRMGRRETLLPISQALDPELARSRLLSALNTLARDSAINVELHYEVGRHFIVPNLTIATEEMKRREVLELAAIKEIKEQADVGDLIIRAGQPVTARQVDLLRRYASIRKDIAQQESFLKAYLPLVSHIALIAMIFGLLYLYLKVFREDIFRSSPKLLAVLLIVGLELLVIALCVRYELNMFAYPVALAPIMFAILFDIRLGVVSSLFIALLLGALNQFDFSLTLFAVCAGSLSAYSVAGVRQRKQLFRTMLYLGAVGVALALVLGYLTSIDYVNYSDDMLDALLGAFITPIAAAAALPFFESLFGFATDITLLELSDLNRPLLKRLALEAPGTFHHSIVVGSLAEAAAKEIGANSLLARVGAYYHDIGKMEIAEYFIENQVGLKSKHDSITPTMSAIILASHVKRGRQMAENADLPDEVMNFIEEHHGTMIMSFFYNRALEQGASVDIEPEFHYPGPTPQTKEAAILMLADGVEAASRTLEDPKPARIVTLAQSIIDSRYHAGELEECDLTLADLGKIRDAFAQILTGVFHQRVPYPSLKTTSKK